ncbi:MAG TPA: nuclear transport factor 2 family protein, partial [Candidatus Sulfotelmatobacter sp.]|nr:nuclear transport factor 2 family protein [Candidatus Sulfotelmatobacter sp.]
MRRFLIRAIAIGLCMGSGILSLSSPPLSAADETPTFRQADKNLADSLARKDAKAVAVLLDERFQWVEANGRIHTKAEVLDDLAEFAADHEGALDVRTVEYLGQVERVLGIHHDQRFAHL